jgi:hypothetical protein
MHFSCPPRLTYLSFRISGISCSEEIMRSSMRQ